MSTSLRNRLVIAANMWRTSIREPLPKLPPGDPAEQIEKFELRLVDTLCEHATATTARDVAEMTWSLVDEREDGDPVKRHVVAWHHKLIKQFGPTGGIDLDVGR